MRIMWNDAKKKCNISDKSFEDIVENSPSALSQEDKEFVTTSFASGMNNYVVEYVFDKAIKCLRDAVFSCGEEMVVGITHWIDKIYISNFFDIFVLRLACDFGLITREEKLKIIEVLQVIQCQKSDNGTSEELDKERAKYLIVSLFDAVLLKDFSPFTESILNLLNTLRTVEIEPYSEDYADIVEASERKKKLIIKILFYLLKTDDLQDAKATKILFKNAENILPFIWDSASLNDKKFYSYYLKILPESSLITKLFDNLQGKIKLQDFATDINVVTSILKNCQLFLSLHYDYNCKNESAPLGELSNITFFPNFFLRSVITPSLVGFLGSLNGVNASSRAYAQIIFENLTSEKWTYYFKNFFEKDDFVLSTLILVDSSLQDFCTLVKKMKVDIDDISNPLIKELLTYAKEQDTENLRTVARKLYFET